MVDKPLTVTYDQLTAGFTAHSVVATLVCAGNRRAEMLKVRPIPGKDPWAHGAISTAEWRGGGPPDNLHAGGGRPDGDRGPGVQGPRHAPRAVPQEVDASPLPLI